MTKLHIWSYSANRAFNQHKWLSQPIVNPISPSVCFIDTLHFEYSVRIVDTCNWLTFSHSPQFIQTVKLQLDMNLQMTFWCESPIKRFHVNQTLANLNWNWNWFFLSQLVVNLATQSLFTIEASQCEFFLRIFTCKRQPLVLPLCRRGELNYCREVKW